MFRESFRRKLRNASKDRSSEGDYVIVSGDDVGEVTSSTTYHVGCELDGITKRTALKHMPRSPRRLHKNISHASENGEAERTTP